MAADGHTPPNHRDRRKLETRRRVLAAAKDLFSRHGYDAVTVKMIADAAGVAVGSVFTTLPSKSAVLDAIVIEALHEQERRIDAAPIGAGDVRARLRSVFAALYDYHDDRVALLLQAISHSWVRAPEAETAVRAAIAPLYRRIERILHEAREARELDDVADLRLVADTLFAAYIANYRRAAYDAWTAQDLAERMERHIVLVLKGAGLRQSSA